MKIRENPTDIRCILFGLGQTVVAYHGRLVNMRLARLYGVNDPEKVRWRLIGRKNRRLYPRLPVYRASAGRTDTVKFIQEIRNALSIDHWIPDSSVENCIRNAYNISGRMLQLLYFLGDEKQGGRFILGIISNIPEIHWDDLTASYSMLRLRKDDNPRVLRLRKNFGVGDKDIEGDERGVVDLRVLSFKERLTKPNRKIFWRGFRRVRRIAQVYGIELEPQHCVYFDDLEENVVAAEYLGLRAFLVTGPRDEEWGSQDSYLSMAGYLTKCGIALPPSDYCLPSYKNQQSLVRPP